MNLLNGLWVCVDQVLVTAFILRTTEILRSEVLRLERSTHRAIKDNDGAVRAVEAIEEGAIHK